MENFNSCVSLGRFEGCFNGKTSIAKVTTWKPFQSHQLPGKRIWNSRNRRSKRDCHSAEIAPPAGNTRLHMSQLFPFDWLHTTKRQSTKYELDCTRRHTWLVSYGIWLWEVAMAAVTSISLISVWLMVNAARASEQLLVGPWWPVGYPQLSDHLRTIYPSNSTLKFNSNQKKFNF